MRFDTISRFLLPVLALGGALALPSPNALPSPKVLSANLRRDNGTGSLVAGEFKGPNADLVLPDYNAIILCDETACDGTCDIISISGLDTDVCYYPGFSYESIVAYSPTGASWDVTIYAGYLTDCDDSVQIPELNECYTVEFDDEVVSYSSFYFLA